MPKKSNAPDGAARPSIPWRIRVRKDEEFRPLSVSMEGTFLGGCLSAAGWRRIPSGERTTRFNKMHYRITLEDGREMAIFRINKTGSWYKADTNSSRIG